MPLSSAYSKIVFFYLVRIYVIIKEQPVLGTAWVHVASFPSTFIKVVQSKIISKIVIDSVVYIDRLEINDSDI